jgi:hypothetical protein
MHPVRNAEGVEPGVGDDARPLPGGRVGVERVQGVGSCGWAGGRIVLAEDREAAAV